MDSSHIRMLLAGLFVAFTLAIVMKDLIRRRPRPPAMPRHKGFRPAKAPPMSGGTPRTGWKAGPRR
nr:hypothetical protein [Sphingomonas sp. Y57]